MQDGRDDRDRDQRLAARTAVEQLGKAEAENILARAAIERLARETGDEETEKLIIKILDEDL